MGCGGLGVHSLDDTSFAENPVRSTREMMTVAQRRAIMKLAWRFVRSSLGVGLAVARHFQISS